MDREPVTVGRSDAASSAPGAPSRVPGAPNGAQGAPSPVAGGAVPWPWLDGYRPASAVERTDIERIRTTIDPSAPWARHAPIHLTGSALVVHPGSGRVLLRWHERMGSWLQVGGHGDPGESDPYDVARREAVEETGLADVRPLPGPAPDIVHVVIVPVPAGKGEPAHEHADVRYALATERPDSAIAESAGAPLRWLAFDDALGAVAEANLRESIRRVRSLLAAIR